MSAPVPGERPGEQVGVADGHWHAIQTVTEDPDTGRTMCGLLAGVASRYGRYLDRLWPTSRACPACAWMMAVRTDTIAEQLRRQHSTSAAVATAILAEARREGDDLDNSRVTQLLASTVDHEPSELIDVDCSEGGCDHPGDCPTVGWACATCSLRAGGWAGEWEGQYFPEGTIAAPCEVLRTLATHYGVVLGEPDEARRVR